MWRGQQQGMYGYLSRGMQKSLLISKQQFQEEQFKSWEAEAAESSQDLGSFQRRKEALQVRKDTEKSLSFFSKPKMGKDHGRSLESVLLTFNFEDKRQYIWFTCFLCYSKKWYCQVLTQGWFTSISLYHNLLSLISHAVTYQTALERKQPAVSCQSPLSYLTSPCGVGFISKLKRTEGLGKSRDQQSQEWVIPNRTGS